MQRLMMSQQMQQALGFLQLPLMELKEAVEQEIEQNPVLELGADPDDPEISPLEQEHLEDEQQEEESPVDKTLKFDERDLKILQQLDEEFRDHFELSAPNYRSQTIEEEKWQSYRESLIQAPTSLFQHLMIQAQESFSSQHEMEMAEAIIGNLDGRGFLQTSLEEIALLGHFQLTKLKKVLNVIQTFEPLGVGAKNLQESLLIQLREHDKKRSLPYRILEGHYEDLVHNRIPVIQHALKCGAEEMKEALQTISKLDLHPGTSCEAHSAQAIRPDVILRQEGDQLLVDIEDDFLPSFRFSRRYLRMLQDEKLTEDVKEFIQSKIASAKWLMRTIHQRNDTLERIATALAVRQREFFLNPTGQLIPLTMKAIAEELQVHESTIARTVANKYIETPRGLMPLRAFFTTALSSDAGEEISAHSVRTLIADLIKGEDKRHPLSDDAIASRIAEQGIQCARRTVAKYRHILKIGNAHQRKKY